MTRYQQRLRAVLVEMLTLGVTQKRASAMLRRPQAQISTYCKMFGIRLPRERGGFAPITHRARERAAVMVALYRDGYTLVQIGEQFGISRERARQLMTKYHGISAADGGQSVTAKRRREKVETSREARYLRKYGCTFAQWRELSAVGRRMVAEGKGRYSTPTYAFKTQRNNAKQRGIGWELTLWEWWCIWLQSGKWDQRGRGQGYVMCRHGDTGPYAVGNVFIASSRQNSHDANRKLEPDLPMGVRKTASGRYVAHRCVNGVKKRLGTHDTPEMAYAAYLMAGPVDRRAA